MYPCRRAYASSTCLCISLSSLTSGIGTPEVWKSTLADVPPLGCTFKSPKLWCDWGELPSDSDMHVGISDMTARRAGNTPLARGSPSVLYWALGIRLREYVVARPSCPLCGQNCLSASEVQVHDHMPSSYIQGYNMPDAGPLRPCATHTHSSGKPTAVQPVKLSRPTLWLLTVETRNLNLCAEAQTMRGSGPPACIRMNYCDTSGITLPCCADRFSTQVQASIMLVE